MPLQDWRDERGWDGVHLLWLAQLLDWIQLRLPPSFRVNSGSVLALTLEAGNGKPDVTVRGWRSLPSAAAPLGAAALTPDRAAVATFTLDPKRAFHIDWHGQLLAAVEVVAPRDKDRLDSRARITRRYLGYLRQGVHLVLRDVCSQPAGFFLADAHSSSAHAHHRPRRASSGRHHPTLYSRA